MTDWDSEMSKDIELYVEFDNNVLTYVVMWICQIFDTTFYVVTEQDVHPFHNELDLYYSVGGSKNYDKALKMYKKCIKKHGGVVS